MVTTQPFGSRAIEVERVSASSACSISSCCLVCSGLHARYTDVLTVFLSVASFLVWMVWSFQWHWLWVGDGAVVEQWLSWRHTDDGRGCYSGYRTQGCTAQWLERLTADQQVRGSIPGGGHGLSSWQDPTIWWIIPHSGTTLRAQSEQ